MNRHAKQGRAVKALRLYREMWLCFFPFATVVTGCHGGSESVPSITIQTEIAPQPARVGPVTVTVQLTDVHQSPIDNAKVTVEGDMAHAGMSPAIAEARELPEGRYAANLELGMAGDWVVLVQIKLASGEMLERQLDVKDVRAN